MDCTALTLGSLARRQLLPLAAGKYFEVSFKNEKGLIFVFV